MANAVETCKPLSNAKPPLGASVIGDNTAAINAPKVGKRLRPTCASPMPGSKADIHANGASSPKVPTEPLAGVIG